MNKIVVAFRSILKFLWLLISMACMVIAVIEILKPNYKQAGISLLFSVLSFYFYYTRQKQLKRQDS